MAEEEEAEENAAGTCVNGIFRLRFGFRRALFVHLYLTNEPLVAFVSKLGMRRTVDVARMMRVFLDVDVKSKHVLDMDMFFDYFDIESSEYNKRAFQLLATFGEKGNQSGNGSGHGTRWRSLAFDHFFVSMYNYGTLVHEALVRFAFDIMACDKEFCNKQDVRELVSLVHPDPGRVKEITSSLMSIMDPHNRGKIPFEKFRKEERRLGSMLFPAFKLQKILQAKILGPSYWNRATKNRRKAGLIGTDLRKEYMELKDENSQKLHQSVAGDAENILGGSTKKNGGNFVGDDSDYPAEEGGLGEARVSTAETPRELESALNRNPQNLKAKVTATEDEGRRTESRANSSSSRSGDGEKGARPMGTRRVTAAAEAAPAAEAVRTHASISDKMLNGDRGGDDMRRRSTVSKTAASAQMVPGKRGSLSEDMQASAEDLHRSDDGAQNPRRGSLSRVSEGSGKRRTSLTAASAQAAPGRRGSMFEDMQVFGPSSAPAGDRRRSSVKASRATRQGSRKVSATSASVDESVAR